MKTVFWLAIFIVFYTYIGYGILVSLLVFLKRKFSTKRESVVDGDNLPSLTLVIAAYNEASLMEEKIANTLSLQYPEGKFQIIIITDGSSDNSPDIVAKYSSRIKLMHSSERRGKIHAIHRAMEQVNTEIVVFTDANTMLNREALLLIARHYADPKVGAVSGEKRVQMERESDATASEGIYWKYESFLKKCDSELYSVVGAAGELFSIRRELYRPVPSDTILDDFMISMAIAAKGYRIVYEPAAYAVETASANISEELKRKIRIAAGGIQSIVRLIPVLNPFRYPLLNFQYVSHRVLRWTITPICLLVILLLNILLLVRYQEDLLYQILLIGQLVFYLMAIAGAVLATRKIKVKLLFIPYYFCVMNYAVIAGMIRYFRGQQSAVWEKSVRK